MSNGPIYTLILHLKKMYGEAPPSSDVGRDIYIMCLGASGCGSSTFINNLIQSSANPDLPRMKVWERDKESQKSCTKGIQWTELVPAENPGWARNCNLLFGDIPGFDNGDQVDLKDTAIVGKIQENLQQRIWEFHGPGKRQCQLGVLLLQDITEDRPRLPGLIGNLSTITRNQFFQNVTVVTTKWSCMADGNDEDGGSSLEKPPTPNPGTSEKWKSLQEKMTKILSPLLPAGVQFEATRAPGDEWRIVEGLVGRVAAGNRIIRIPPQSPKKHSWLRRWFDWISRSWRQLS